MEWINERGTKKRQCYRGELDINDDTGKEDDQTMIVIVIPANLQQPSVDEEETEKKTTNTNIIKIKK